MGEHGYGSISSYASNPYGGLVYIFINMGLGPNKHAQPLIFLSLT